MLCYAAAYVPSQTLTCTLLTIDWQTVAFRCILYRFRKHLYLLASSLHLFLLLFRPTCKLCLCLWQCSQANALDRHRQLSLPSYTYSPTTTAFTSGPVTPAFEKNNEMDMQSADAYSKSGLDNGHGNFGSWTPSGMVAGVPEPVVYQQQQNQTGPELFYGRWQGLSRKSAVKCFRLTFANVCSLL